MARSSKFIGLDQDIILEFIYHDQVNLDSALIETDDNGSHIKFLDTDSLDPTQSRYLVHELGGDVVEFTVNVDGIFIVINQFASRELQLKNGKTYKFNLTALNDPINFTITGGGSTSYSNVSKVLTYTPNTNGTFDYRYTDTTLIRDKVYTSGKIVVGDTANSLFSMPDQETGNTIKTASGEIGRYYAVQHDIDGTRFALLNNSLDYLETPAWTGTPIADFEPVTIPSGSVWYDTVRLHLKTGFSFAARGYDGFLFQIKAPRISGIFNYLTSIVYKNSSNFEIQNPNPFVISGTAYSKFIEIKVPALVHMYDNNINLDFQDAFFADHLENTTAKFDSSAGYTINFKLIDRIVEVAGIEYADVSEGTSLTIPQEDEFQDIVGVIEEASDGDYFKLYGTKDGSVNEFEDYILTRQSTSGDDITVFHDIEVRELLGLSYIQTFQTTFVQTEEYDQPILFRPIIKNSNVASGFLINYILRIYNETDNTQIVKRSTLFYRNTSKYGKRLAQVNLGSNSINKIYNTLANTNSTANLNSFVNSIRPTVGETKYVPVAIDTTNILAGSSLITLDSAATNQLSNLQYFTEGTAIITLSKVSDNFIKFKVAQQDGSSTKAVSLVNAEDIELILKSGNISATIKHDPSFPDIDLGIGEMLFKIPKSVAIRFDESDANLNPDKFYINIINGGTSSLLYYGNVNII
jgi:hypothetical protein